MEPRGRPDFVSVGDAAELNASQYSSALRNVARFSFLVLFLYPFLLVFLVAFFMENVFALAAFFALYWLMFFYMESRRYRVDVRLRGINTDFRNYIIHSPFSQSYFKFSVVPMLIFFGELIGYYVRMTAYEGAALVVAVIAILVATLYVNPWLKGQLKHAMPLQSNYINTRLLEITQREGIPQVNPMIIDGKTFNVANAYCVGVFKPKICITDYALENVSEEEAVTILTHEISHFKRRDVLKMAIPAFSASAVLMVMVALVAYWSTEPSMIPFLQRVMPAMIEGWVVIAMAGFLFLPAVIRSRGEIKADELASNYFGPDRTVEALVKLHHLNRLSVYGTTSGRSPLLIRIGKIRRYRK